MPASRSVVSVLLRELGDFSLHPQGRPAGGRLRRPSSAAEPGRRARPHRNACRLHDLTGQWTHFSRACPVDGRAGAVVWWPWSHRSDVDSMQGDQAQ
jgi:hypothetical protein